MDGFSLNSGTDFDDPELTATLKLSLVPGVGPLTFLALLDHFGSAAGVLSQPADQLILVDGVGPKLAAAIVAGPALQTMEEMVGDCRDNQIEIVVWGAENYPSNLKNIHDPPLVLFQQGNRLPGDDVSIAIVGARHSTHYGEMVAEQLSRGLAMAGFTIVSGLARGIDAAAHRAAIASGGRTIAVLGGGLLEVYPPENATLARQIARQGCLMSENPPRFKPRGTSFPQRNRIITGISLGVIVVEAATRSGALISARLGMEQGREVFAVPGRIDSRMSKGCHQLIKDGATLVQSVDDVLEQLGPLAQPVMRASGESLRHPGELKLNDQERQVLNAIDSDPTTVDVIVARSQLPVSRVLATASVLEIRRLIRRAGGSAFCRI